MFLQTNTAAVTERPVPPTATMLNLLFGKHITYALSAVARLAVADQLAEGPLSARVLSERLGVDEDSLYRVMRMLAAVGVFEQMPYKCFALTPVGELLRTGGTNSLRHFAIQLGDSWSTRPFEHFTETIRRGTDGVTLAFGKNLFDLFAEEVEQAETFHRSMSGISAAMSKSILNAYDFSSISRLADIGGGHGLLLASILNRNPHMKGVVFDLPEVISGAAGQPHLAACEDRIQFEGGSFFEFVPSGCDAYMMKFILHDWSDEHCRQILNQVRRQLPAHGRLLVFEQVIENCRDLSFAKLLDIEMLALTVGGRERTESEFAELFASSGLSLKSVTRTEDLLCVLEVRPV